MIAEVGERALHRACPAWVVVLCAIYIVSAVGPSASGQATRQPLLSLHEASLAGEIERVTELLDRGADINQPWRTKGGVSPLMLAIRGGHGELIDLLLDRGAKVSHASRTGQTALHYAAERGEVALCERLLNRGAKVNARADRGRMPLHAAAYRGRAAVCRLLVAHGAMLNVRDATRQTALHLALGVRGLGAAEALIDSGSNVNLRDSAGVLPLARIAEKGNLSLIKKTTLLISDRKAGLQIGAMNEAQYRAYLSQSAEVAEFLIESGADPEMILESGLGLIHLACELGSRPLVELSLAGNVDPNVAASPSGWTPMHFASFHPHPQIIQLLLLKGADLNLVDGEGRTPLHIASLAGVLPAAQKLLERGADVNAQDKLGNTALHYAATGQRRVMVETYLRAGSDATLENLAGQTAFHIARKHKDARILAAIQAAVPALKTWKPSADEGRVLSSLATRSIAERQLASGYPLLHIAVMHGDVSSVQLALESGGDVSNRGPYGYQALHYAAGGGDLEMMSVLLEAKASVSDRDNTAGWSPLHFSVSGGQVEATRRLVAAGADVNAVDGAGRSPLNVAALHGDARIAAALRK